MPDSVWNKSALPEFLNFMTVKHTWLLRGAQWGATSNEGRVCPNIAFGRNLSPRHIETVRE